MGEESKRKGEKKNKKIRGASRFSTLMTQLLKSLLQYLCESGEFGGSLFFFIYSEILEFGFFGWSDFGFYVW